MIKARNGGPKKAWGPSRGPQNCVKPVFYAKGDNSVTICANTFGLAAMMSPLCR